MFDLTFALLGIVTIIVGALLWQFNGSVKDVVEYFKNDLGILWSIVLFTGVFIVVAIATLLLAPKVKADGFKDLTYLNYAEVYIGMITLTN